jgi:hypothetical protein
LSSISDEPIVDEFDRVLPSKTYCVYVGCGKIYVTVDYDEGEMCRIHINRNSKDLTCPMTAIDSLNRSSTFQVKREPRQLLKDEIGGERHCCEKYGVAVTSWRKSGRMTGYSCQDAVARILIKNGVSLD